MNDHPGSEEHLAEDDTPGLMTIACERGDPGDDADQVYHEECRRRYEEAHPPEHVEFRFGLFSLVIGGSGVEAYVDACKGLDQPLEDGKEVRGDAADDPELLVPPPLFNTDTAPPHLKYVCGDDRKEKASEHDACYDTNLHFTEEQRDIT